MRVLLHICCAPCTIYILNRLRQSSYEVEGLFYNPNIHPVSEYINRKDSVLRICESSDFNVHFFRDLLPEDFFRKVSFHEQEQRCHLCWHLRLGETAEYAVKNGFDAFTTTLLISPYQDHARIRQIGEEISEKYSVAFIYEDFRKGFKESHAISRDMGLYHQKYCGCIYSERERYMSKGKV